MPVICRLNASRERKKMVRFIWFVHFLDRSQCIRQRQRERIEWRNWIKWMGAHVILYFDYVPLLSTFSISIILSLLIEYNTQTPHHPVIIRSVRSIHMHPTMNGVEPRIEWNTQKRKKYTAFCLYEIISAHH